MRDAKSIFMRVFMPISQILIANFRDEIFRCISTAQSSAVARVIRMERLAARGHGADSIMHLAVTNANRMRCRGAAGCGRDGKTGTPKHTATTDWAED